MESILHTAYARSSMANKFPSLVPSLVDCGEPLKEGMALRIRNVYNENRKTKRGR